MEVSPIDQQIIEKTIAALQNEFGEGFEFRIEKGVKQTAALWREKDGTAEDFQNFCLSNFIPGEQELDQLFESLSRNFETINGSLLKISKDLKRKLHLDMGEIQNIDLMFGSYSPHAHLTEDFFSNKIAFVVTLNFPYYSLDQMREKADEWSRKEWAYARMGGLYTARPPAELLQKVSSESTASDTYISEYNIYMGNIRDEEAETWFPEDLKLITHWGLRDELKSNYAEADGLKKQKMIYQVMKRIIDQSIPEKVINSDKYYWDPYENVLTDSDGNTIDYAPEPDARYQYLLNNFKAQQKLDAYYPNYKNYIQRKFEGDYEIPQEDVEKLFRDFVSSPTVKKVGELISQRLGRELQPFDIWYDGFKARSAISGDKLDRIVNKKYPTKEAFEKDLPNLLINLGWKKSKAESIAGKIQVDPSRGAGHAWGAGAREFPAHLRTRVGTKGMDYKGYNIAMHEFGHTVEQTITLHDVDYYLLHGVPNTSFTEALAFIFQKRDLAMLGLSDQSNEKEAMMALDNFWSSYEIMGVSLVDMEVWKWMYENPDASSSALKEAIIQIAKDVWNQYYAPVFGMKDEPILAIYSHMIDNPLYLSAYPIGHLIDFQLEEEISGKNFADEVMRIFTQGRLIPQYWMQQAVGKRISGEPLIEETEKALEVVR
ncbi:MAG: hypothetical protein U5Q03_12060 [Bacteroidota bacterium]|nr:hypothetical protein [Bacteroidota bacterium]